MSDTPPPPNGRYANGRFGPGNPGRRAGSRNRASHQMIMSVLEDFEEHKRQVLERLRTIHSPNYFATIACLAPKMLEPDEATMESYSDTEIAKLLVRARQVMDTASNARSAFIELHLLLGTPPVGEG